MKPGRKYNNKTFRVTFDHFMEVTLQGYSSKASLSKFMIDESSNQHNNLDIERVEELLLEIPEAMGEPMQDLIQELVREAMQELVEELMQEPIGELIDNHLLVGANFNTRGMTNSHKMATLEGNNIHLSMANVGLNSNQIGPLTSNIELIHFKFKTTAKLLHLTIRQPNYPDILVPFLVGILWSLIPVIRQSSLHKPRNARKQWKGKLHQLTTIILRS